MLLIAGALAVTIKPPFAACAKAVTARSISDASPRRPGATPPLGRRQGLDAEQLSLPRASAASRNTAARVTRGEISLSSSSHFPSMLYSNGINPVAFPPGRR